MPPRFGGYATILEDISAPRLAEAVRWITQAFDEGVSRGKVDAGVRDRAVTSDFHRHLCSGRHP